MLTKVEQEELRGVLRSDRDGAFSIALRKLIEHDLERAKISLIDLTGEPLLQMQGEARSLRRFLTYLTAREGTTQQV
jgi:hypothetical protein